MICWIVGASRRALVAPCLALGLLLVGCGGDRPAPDDDVDRAVGTAGSTGNRTRHPGSDRLTADVGDIGVPLAPAADAVATMESGPMTIVQFIVPLDEREATISFYDDWTAGQPDEYLRTAAESGGVSWQNDPEAGEDKRIIAVLTPLEGDDFVAATLTVGPAE